MSDYTDDMYDRYMYTGEGAEFFEDIQEEEYIEDDYIEDDETEEVVEYRDLNEYLDDVIRNLEEQLKEKKRIIAAQNKKKEKQ